jgi:hypothetical protein
MGNNGSIIHLLHKRPAVAVSGFQPFAALPLWGMKLSIFTFCGWAADG